MTSDPAARALISPARLIRMLQDAEWQVDGGRDGLYVRYAPPGDELGSRIRNLLIPLDEEATDFEQLLSEAIATLQRLPRESAASSLLNRLTSAPTDEFSFAKETSAPKGWIKWDEGETLHMSVRALLIASAKSARETRSYFGNRFGQFANRFMDEVMMGQTAVSSYVVRAYVPTDRSIPMHAGVDAERGLGIEGIDILPSRTISQTVSRSLEVATEALSHYATHQSLAGFTDGDSPISYESVQALKHIAEGAEYANITIKWDRAGDGGSNNLIGQTRSREQDFTFTGAHVPVLERAAIALAQPEPPRPATARGMVHLLSRSDAGGPGVIGLTTVDGAPAKKVRAHLSNDDYVATLNAHQNGRMIRVSGNLQKEGNLSHLYNARLEQVYAEDETPEKKRSGKTRVSTEDGPNLFDTLDDET